MLQEDHREDFLVLAMPHVTPPLFRREVWQEPVFHCARLPSGYAAWQGCEGRGKAQQHSVEAAPLE